MTLELRSPVSVQLPDGTTIEAEIWGRSWDMAQGIALYDVYCLTTREWHKGLARAQIERRAGA